MQHQIRPSEFAIRLLLVCLACADCRLRSTEPRQVAAKPAKPAASSKPEPPQAPSPSSSETALDAEAQSAAAVIALAGVGSDPASVESASAAARASRQALATGASCLDAAVAGVVVLEDDASLNAGTGAALRLDGTAELDAAVMDSHGRFGAVTGVSDVKNPVRVARAVADTPERILSGAGATHLARTLGIEPFDPRTPASRARHRQLLAEREARDAGSPQPDVDAAARVIPVPAIPAAPAAAPIPPASAAPAPVRAPALSAAPSAIDAATSKPAAHANAAAGNAPAASSHDTVGVLVRCGSRDFAGAVSGGGPWLSPPGRIGDVPVPGGALYVGQNGAVLVSGPGEWILTRLWAKTEYAALESATPAQAAEHAAASDLPDAALVVARLGPSRAEVTPLGAAAWAVLDPTLRTSAEAH